MINIREDKGTNQLKVWCNDDDSGGKKSKLGKRSSVLAINAEVAYLIIQT